MDLYFSPLSCSMATRISLYEAGADARYIQVDLKSKRLVADGADFLAINDMGQVPVLRTDDGALLTENPAILLYVADQFPEAGLAPRGGFDRYRLQQWLGFANSELHKATFVPLLDSKCPEGGKAYAKEKTALRLGHLARHLEDREFVLDRFTVADAYLTTVLNWARYSGVDLAGWQGVEAYYGRMMAWPSIARAIAEEMALYRAEQTGLNAA
ncbi:MAG TPA: glutathione S-transferase N-terminal domain-containing protein [Xanthobacteraceae bacterium]|nr:glutathione S-transferase N-terminal domain-containing protein [Xanthobacteraceae bacterium]